MRTKFLNEFTLDTLEVSQEEKSLILELKKYNDIALENSKRVRKILRKLYDNVDVRSNLEPFIGQLLEDYEDTIIPGMYEGISPEGYSIDKLYSFLLKNKPFRESRCLKESKFKLPLNIRTNNTYTLKKLFLRFIDNIKGFEPFEMQDLDTLIETLEYLRKSAVPIKFESLNIRTFLSSFGVDDEFIDNLEKIHEKSPLARSFYSVKFDAPFDEFCASDHGQETLGTAWYDIRTAYGVGLFKSSGSTQEFMNAIGRIKKLHRLDSRKFDKTSLSSDKFYTKK